MYKFIYKHSPKSDYFGYFSLRTATSAYYDVKELIDPASFLPAMIFGVFEAKYLWKFLSI